MVTIYDIAEKTGFSAPTISKALNDTGTLSDKTRKKILAVAKELGYKPNMAAKALSTKKSMLIGIIFEDYYQHRGFSHPLFGKILNKFRSEMETAGYDVIFLSRNFDGGKSDYLEHCVHRNVDGVVIINPNDTYDSLENLANSSIPCVSTNDCFPKVPVVVTENIEAGYIATKYFMQKGHKKIAYISGYSTEFSPASIERLKGLKKAFEEAGLSYDDSYVEYCSSWTREVGYSAMESLYNRHNDITAVFAANDNMAIGAMNWCKENGLKIPDDISFIGFDDEDISSYYSPPLTTFRQDSDTIAELAADNLLNMLVSIPVKSSIKVKADFIERNSVADLTV